MAPDRESDRRSVYVVWSSEKERGVFISRPAFIVAAMYFRSGLFGIAAKIYEGIDTIPLSW